MLIPTTRHREVPESLIEEDFAKLKVGPGIFADSENTLFQTHNSLAICDRDHGTN
jgi:hypothetical protein